MTHIVAIIKLLRHKIVRKFVNCKQCNVTCVHCLDFGFFVPCSPTFFDLLISLGQHGLMILRLESGPALGPRRVIPYSPIKLLEFSFQPIRTHFSDNCCCCIQKTVDEAWSSRRLIPKFSCFAPPADLSLQLKR